MSLVEICNRSESKSTDKLAVLADIVNKLPDAAFEKLKFVSVEWEHISDVVVPVVKIEFYEG